MDPNYFSLEPILENESVQENEEHFFNIEDAYQQQPSQHFQHQSQHFHEQQHEEITSEQQINEKMSLNTMNDDAIFESQQQLSHQLETLSEQQKQRHQHFENHFQQQQQQQPQIPNGFGKANPQSLELQQSTQQDDQLHQQQTQQLQQQQKQQQKQQKAEQMQQHEPQPQPQSPASEPKLTLRQLSEQRKLAQKELELKMKKQAAEQLLLKEQELLQQPLLREQKFINEQQEKEKLLKEQQQQQEQQQQIQQQQQQQEQLIQQQQQQERERQRLIKEEQINKLIETTPQLPPTQHSSTQKLPPIQHQAPPQQQEQLTNRVITPVPPISPSKEQKINGFSDQKQQQLPQQQLPQQQLPQQQHALPQQHQLQQSQLQDEEPENGDVKKVKAPEIARSMRALFESGNVKGSSDVRKTLAEEEIATQILTSGPGVYENEPTRLEGVVRADEVTSPEEEVRGMESTKKKKDDWMVKANNQFVVNREPIMVAEDEGKIIESQPIQRQDVLREDTYDEDVMVSNKGMTKSLRDKWSNMDCGYVKEKREIKVVEREDEKSVSENEPTRRDDVHREDDFVLSPEEEIAKLKSGNTTQIKEYWKTQRDSKGNSIDRSGLGTPTLENQMGGLSEQDMSRYECDSIGRGTAKVLANKWQNMDNSWRNRKIFVLESDLAREKEAGVFENKPGGRNEDITVSGSLDDEVMAREGLAKMMSKKFADEEFWNPKSPKSPPIMEMAEGPGVHENVPENLSSDIIRYGDESHDHLYMIRKQGLTSDLKNRWMSQNVGGAEFSKVEKDFGTLLEREKAIEAGVFENQPEVRQDVYREEDYEDELVSISKTRNLRELWSNMGAVEDNAEKVKKSRLPQQIRFTPPREKSPA